MRRNPMFRQLMGDIFSGAQDYTSLKQRLWGQLGVTLSDFVASVLNIEAPAHAAAPRGSAGAD
jgi:hypothetical protein